MAFPAVGDPGTDTVAPPNDWASKLLNTLAVSMATDGTLVSSFIKLGTNPASAGAVRLANAVWIAGRNAANSADVNMFQVDSSNRIIYGARMESNSFFSEANTTGLRGLVASFATRYGAGTVSDRTMGLYTVVNDSASCKRTAITNVANNGSGLFRVTAASHGVSTGDRVMIYGAGGVPNANNAWTATRIDANNVDLQGSTFAGTYTSGGFITTGGQIYGAQLTLTPTITRDFGASGGSAAFGDDVIGCAVYNNGTTKGTAAFNAGGNTAGGGTWLYGLEFDGTYDTGINWSGTCNNYGIDFRAGTFTAGLIRLKNAGWVVGRNNAGSADVNLLRITTGDKLELASNVVMNGSGIGLDLSGGTYTSGPIKLANNQFIVARNNANSADLSVVGVDTTDSIQFGTVTRHAAGLIVSDTKNIQFSTGTGTKIGTTSSEKLAFWGGTPAARPSAYTQTFSTADKTHAARTSASTTTTAATQTTPWGYSTQAQADAIVTNLNAVRADLDDTAQLLNAVVDDLQAMGLLA